MSHHFASASVIILLRGESSFYSGQRRYSIPGRVIILRIEFIESLFLF